MKSHRIAASIVVGMALAAAAPGGAQTVSQTKVHTDTNVRDGVATTKRTVTHTTKRKTRKPRKILGVKIGHKTAVSKTVRETKISTNGDSSTTVKTSR